MVNAVCLGMLSCVPVLAAWAVLVLRLLCRRRWVRRALACLALALTIVGHCLYATAACLVLVAHQGHIFIRICWTVGIFLIPFSFSALQDLHLLGGDEEFTYPSPCMRSQFPLPQFSVLPCDHLTEAEEAVVNAVWLKMLSCVPVVAAGAVLVQAKTHRLISTHEIPCLPPATTEPSTPST